MPLLRELLDRRIRDGGLDTRRPQAAFGYSTSAVPESSTGSADGHYGEAVNK
jgi:hypothetical protein